LVEDRELLGPQVEHFLHDVIAGQSYGKRRVPLSLARPVPEADAPAAVIVVRLEDETGPVLADVFNQLYRPPPVLRGALSHAPRPRHRASDRSPLLGRETTFAGLCGQQ